LIPAGTGSRRFQKNIVANKEEYTKMLAGRLAEQEVE
jgi:hypothetical protein